MFNADVKGWESFEPCGNCDFLAVVYLLCFDATTTALNVFNSEVIVVAGRVLAPCTFQCPLRGYNLWVFGACFLCCSKDTFPGVGKFFFGSFPIFFCKFFQKVRGNCLLQPFPCLYLMRKILKMLNGIQKFYGHLT